MENKLNVRMPGSPGTAVIHSDGKTVVITKNCTWCHQSAETRVLRGDFDRWVGGAYAQEAFPELRPELREQLISGTHPNCWDEMWPEEDEDE